jgi:pimeloyl-ACP methyl ester carboxylesterase/DNA-binding CsgD family transcriptional regulator
MGTTWSLDIKIVSHAMRSYTTAMKSVASPQIRFCTASDGVSIAFGVSGSGLPLVKTPNWLNHLELDAHSPVWRSWIDRMSRYHTLVRYDARGCGLSDRGASPPSFSTNRLDLEAVVDAARLDKFVLFGASQGAAIAIEYAALYPERVSHLVLCGAYLRGAAKRDGSLQAKEEAQALLKLVELGWGRENSAFRQVFATQFIPDSMPEHLLAFDELQRRTVSSEGAADLLRTFYDIDVTDFAAQVRCPTLVLHARLDARIPFDEGRRVAAAIAQAEFVPLESRNHILLDHQPAWEQFFVEVESFLQRHCAVATAGSLPTLEELTAAESGVLDLVASGVNNAEIATRLGISTKTVRNHINHIFSKLGVKDRSQAIVMARDAGFGKRSLI